MILFLLTFNDLGKEFFDLLDKDVEKAVMVVEDDVCDGDVVLVDQEDELDVEASWKEVIKSKSPCTYSSFSVFLRFSTYCFVTKNSLYSNIGRVSRTGFPD